MFYDCQPDCDINKCLICGMSVRFAPSSPDEYFCSDECYEEAKKKVKKLEG